MTSFTYGLTSIRDISRIYQSQDPCSALVGSEYIYKGSQFGHGATQPHESSSIRCQLVDRFQPSQLYASWP